MAKSIRSRLLAYGLFAVFVAACSASLPLLSNGDGGTDAGPLEGSVSPGPDVGESGDGALVADGGDGALVDGPSDAGAACSPPLRQDGSVIFGCLPTHVAFSAVIYEPLEAGTCPPGMTKSFADGYECCAIAVDASATDVPVEISFDVDSGVLVWNGRVFAAMPGPPYQAFPPTNNEETYDAAASVLARGGASLGDYERFFKIYRAATSQGGDFTMSTVTRVTLDPDAGTLAVVSRRHPNAIYAQTCWSRARIVMTTPTVSVGTRDAGSD